MTKDKSLIQSCVDHINTAVDVDPWAKELVIEMVKEVLEQLKKSNQELKNQNDLISRRAAIDLWDKYHPYIATKATAYDRELRALPSAQPEIIHCKECIHKIKNGNHYKCNYWDFEDPKDDGFCSFAERRTDSNGRD